jgi:hypothetical protein
MRPVRMSLVGAAWLTGVLSQAVLCSAAEGGAGPKLPPEENAAAQSNPKGESDRDLDVLKLLANQTGWEISAEDRVRLPKNDRKEAMELDVGATFSCKVLFAADRYQFPAEPALNVVPVLKGSDKEVYDTRTAHDQSFRIQTVLSKEAAKRLDRHGDKTVTDWQFYLVVVIVLPKGVELNASKMIDEEMQKMWAARKAGPAPLPDTLAKALPAIATRVQEAARDKRDTAPCTAVAMWYFAGSADGEYEWFRMRSESRNAATGKQYAGEYIGEPRLQRTESPAKKP